MYLRIEDKQEEELKENLYYLKAVLDNIEISENNKNNLLEKVLGIKTIIFPEIKEIKENTAIRDTNITTEDIPF